MLPRSYRLTGVKNFQAVEESGEIFQSQNFGVAYVNRKDNNPSRFAFVVSTKLSKEAVDRNRIKRLIRESVRQILIYLEKGYDVVFLAKQSIMRTPSDVIIREVKKALRDAKLAK